MTISSDGSQIGLGPFEILEQAGSGAMAEVWRARHCAQDVPVAIKFVTAPVSKQAFYRDRFAAEVRAVARLNHPGIIQLADYGAVPQFQHRDLKHLALGSPFLVMEWVDGGTLRERLGRMKWTEIRAVLLSLLDALSVAHAHEIIHRDLKPDNVLLADRGPVLSDFGVAFAGDSQDAQHMNHAMVGTPNYMAPEQIRGDWRAFGPWTDLYALGCLAYALVDGRAPYSCDSFNDVIRGHLKAEVPPLQYAASVPVGFEKWVHRLLEKRTGARFRLAADAAIALLDLPNIEIPRRRSECHAGDLSENDSTVVMPQVFVPVTDLTWIQDANSPSGPGLPTTWRVPEYERSMPSLSGTGRSLFDLATPPLFGRERERDILWSLLGGIASESSYKSAYIVGQAGQGKSALAHWISKRAHALGVAIPHVISHQQPNTERCGLGGLLLKYFRCEGLDANSMQTRIHSVTKQIGLDGFSSVFCEMMSGQRKNTSGVQSAYYHSNRERFEAVCQLLNYLTQERARILVLDDVQWGDETALFLKYMSQHWSSLPVLVLATVRDDGQLGQSLASRTLKALFKAENSTVLALGPLSDMAHRQLLTYRLSLDSSVVDLLSSRAARNPLFAREMISHFIATGILVPGPDGFKLTTDASISLPSSIKDLWEERLQSALAPFPMAARQVLEVASLVGRQVDHQLLERVCAAVGLSIDKRWIESCFDARLIESNGVGQWAFVHGLLQETLQSAVRTSGRWQVINGACADELLRLSHPAKARIAGHLFQAGRYADAYTHYVSAADNLRYRSDYHRAQKSLLQAAKACRFAGYRLDSPKWVDIRWRWAICSRVRGTFDSALRHAKRTLTAAERLNEVSLKARGLLEIARCIDIADGSDKALGHYVKAAQTAREGPQSQLLINCLSALGRAYRTLSQFDKARAIYREALGLCRQFGSPMSHGNTLLGLARIEITVGHIKAGKSLAKDAHLLFLKTGSKWSIAQSLNVIGDAERLLGHLPAAEAAYHGATELLHSISSIDAPYGDANMAIALMEQQKWVEAAQRLDLAIDGARKTGAKRSLLMITAVSLLPDAMLHRWSHYDRKTQFLEPLLHGKLADLDIPLFVEKAARYLTQIDERERAEFAWHLTVNQLSRLGRVDDAEKIRAEWRSLVPGS
ncbi:MAG: protein kinase [Myxococcota bacterium]|nr:protein kinase [Myxococcota bacterium]